MKYYATLSLLALLALATKPALGQSAITDGRVACAGGSAAGYACSSVDLMAFVPVDDLGGNGDPVNDIWGWTDPDSGREYAIVGREDGTSFVDVTDPIAPTLIGNLPRTKGTRPSIWRDIKVYANHAYIVADGAGLHGMQVFDLTQLRDFTGTPFTFEETAHYEGIGSAHNIAINEDTGFAYIVGASGVGINGCGGGLHMLNIQIPDRPRFAGCFADVGTGRAGTGYSHDVQCVLYHGPDADYQGREICVGSNETALSLVDVTDKANPRPIARATYPNVAYAHQGWFTEDHRYFVSDDELDEGRFYQHTRTLFWDFQDLDDPQLIVEYFSPEQSRDHNQYVRGQYVFQANYTSGLRILDISDIMNPREVAYFDTTEKNGSFAGAWSNYPFFPSGNVVVSSGDEGLFVVQPIGLNLTVSSNEAPEIPAAFTFAPAFPNPFTDQATLTLHIEDAQATTVAVYDLLGREVRRLYDGHPYAGQTLRLRFVADGLPAGLYVARATGPAFATTQRLTLVR